MLFISKHNMEVISTNYLAVLVGAIINMVLGGLWYGPLFGKAWTKLSGMTAETMDAAKRKGMSKSYALMFVGALIMSAILWHEVALGSEYIKMYGAWSGVITGAWLWLGFVAPTTVGMVLWEGKPWKYWFIVSGYYLVALAILGGMFAVWM